MFNIGLLRICAFPVSITCTVFILRSMSREVSSWYISSTQRCTSRMPKEGLPLRLCTNREDYYMNC